MVGGWGWRGFVLFPVGCGAFQNAVEPKLGTRGGEGIGEGGGVLPVPGGGAGLRGCGEDVAGPQSDQAVESKGYRGGSFDGGTGPLSPCLDAEMGTHSLEGDVDLPASHE